METCVAEALLGASGAVWIPELLVSSRCSLGYKGIMEKKMETTIMGYIGA